MAEDKRDILGNSVETLRDPLKGDRAPPNYRGNVSLASVPILPEKYWQVEEVCASRAIRIAKEQITLDMGKCILCGRCGEAAPDIFKIGSKYAPPAKTRGDLVESSGSEADKSYEAVGKELKEKIGKILGRSLAVREVDAGSCNGCEVEITALNNPVYDIERFGIHFVASPRHADVLLVTGPASRNMEVALKRTYEATPDPKIVVAVGACGCSGGIFGDTCATTGGIDKVVPVDVYIPGCPPRPEALLHGLLMAVDRIGKAA
ncbi:NADH-quinone oxidoreductase subunit NuoB [Nitrososphaera sp.]|uniref:NADH-quinone oxidoreductase subunit NuoB n=1 Tax=Nitrososphaera sp. TaxID=1971748 RepID=UPI00317A0BC0